MSANTKLYVDKNTPVANEPAGQPRDHWEEVRPAWFEVETLTGTENQTQGNADAYASHKMTCHFFQGAHPRMRLRAGEDVNKPTRVFNVISVIDEHEQHRKLIWTVSEAL